MAAPIDALNTNKRTCEGGPEPGPSQTCSSGTVAAEGPQHQKPAAERKRVKGDPEPGPSQTCSSGTVAAEGPQHQKPAAKRQRVKDTVSGESRSKPLELTEPDYKWLWKRRRYWWLSPSEQTKDKLAELIEPLKEDEEAWIREQRRQISSRFSGRKKNDLVEELKSLGVVFSKLSKHELMEALEEAHKGNKNKQPKLDENQCAVIKKVIDNKVIVVHAGPGSGKTTTLSAVVSDFLSERPRARVLVLSFNKTSKREITSMLSKHHVKLLGKEKALSEKCPPGCLVTTFNLYGFWAVGLPEQTDLMSKDERVSLRQSEALLRLVSVDEAPRRWDLLVVDEAQDLNETHGQIVQLLTTESTHLVAAGDEYMRQYPGRSWFYRLKKGKTPGKDLVVLRKNYRSSTEIVAALNTFRQANAGEEEETDMDNSHSDDKQDGPDEDEDDDDDDKADHDLVSKQLPVETVSGTFQKCQLPSAELCAKLAYQMTHRSSSRDTFAISPVTVSDKNEKLTQLIYNTPSEKQPKSICQVHKRTCPTAVPLSELNSCVISTSRGVRGAGRKRVVLYGVTQSFAQEGVPRSLLTRLIYVAMSRAEDELYIITDGPLPSDSPLRCIKSESLEPDVDGSPVLPDKSIQVTVLANESYKPQHKILQVMDPSVQSLCEQRGELAIELHRSKQVAGVISGFCHREELKLATSLRRKELLRLARAKLALQYACSLKQNLNYQQLSLPVPPKSPDAYFAVDIETAGNPRFPVLTEIGAVAFTTSGEVLGTYHRVLGGAEPLSHFREDTEEGNTQSESDEDDEPMVTKTQYFTTITPPFPYEYFDLETAIEKQPQKAELLQKVQRVCSGVEKEAKDQQEDPVSKLAGEDDGGSFSLERLTGLHISNDDQLETSGTAALKPFHRWVGRISQQPCYIYWTAAAKEALKLEPSYDVNLLFGTWLATEDMKRRSGLKLKDSVRQVLGPQFPFEPNRAFEDAVATASVFLALTQNEGR